jgi:hypothetical protein
MKVLKMQNATEKGMEKVQNAANADTKSKIDMRPLHPLDHGLERDTVRLQIVLTALLAWALVRVPLTPVACGSRRPRCGRDSCKG